MLEHYKTIYEGGEGELVEKKSRFIATVRPVDVYKRQPTPSSPRSSSAWKSSAPETPSPLSWYASSLIWSMEITPFMEHSRRHFAGLRSRYVHIFYSVMADSVVTE